MSRRFVCLTILLTSFVLTSVFVSADDQQLLLKKSQLLIQKGARAEEIGNFEDAAAFYEDALQAYPRNIMPVLMLGKLLARIGMYAKAAERLQSIPLQQLPPVGQAEVHLLFGKIALARASVEEAGAAYKKALDVNPENIVALIRKMVCEVLLGFSVSENHLERFAAYDSFQDLPRKEQILTFLLDLHLGHPVRAFNTCVQFAEKPANAETDSGFFPDILSLAPVFFVLSLPLGLNGVIAALYYVLIFSLLVFVATRLSAPTAVWHSVVFIMAGTAFMMVASSLCYKNMMIAAMLDEFSAYDSVWIIPKMLLAGHFVALALFLVFPAFLRLPAEQRPLRYELYGIWFFCWFFMLFVLAFQSRLGLGTRVTIMVVSAVLAMLNMVILPLGRFVIFNVANAAGFSGIVSVGRKDVSNTGAISYTDAKIIESHAWKLLENDSFEEVILTARKLLSTLDRKNFASLWKAMILGQICREDFLEAQRNTAEFIESFKGTTVSESGRLLDAYLRCRKGDHATAVVIIRGLSDRCVKSFSNDETGLSLLILGCCGVAFKEYVQAHIDLGKALTCARLPFLRAEILAELTELDLQMKAREALIKWKARSAEIRGGEKTRSLVQVVQSMVAFFEGQREQAVKLAEMACNIKTRNGRAFYWYGHLLCLEGRAGDAENLLSRMTPECYCSVKLMNEITGSATLE